MNLSVHEKRRKLAVELTVIVCFAGMKYSTYPADNTEFLNILSTVSIRPLEEKFL
jgi:hypothetical protein